MKNSPPSLVLALLLTAPSLALAIFVRPEIEKVPTARLIANLEKKVADAPKSNALIQRGEELELHVRDVPASEKLSQAYKVTSAGVIQLPGLGDLAVAGKTLEEVESAVEAKLPPKKEPAGEVPRRTGRSLEEKRVYASQSPEQRPGRCLPRELADLHFALGRVHSMAYALQTERFDAAKHDGMPYFGSGPLSGLPPGKVTRPVADAKIEEAKRHLQQAIAELRKATDVDAEHWLAQVGLAWCLQQSGEKAEARQTYLKAIRMAWKEEESIGFIFDTSLTEEITRYLIPLLDPKLHRKEIEEARKLRDRVRELGRAVTPVLIPLQPGLRFEELVNPNAQVKFDLDGSGIPREWGWITPKASWLVFDREATGKITSGIQMLGSVTFWIFWENGYHALAALDNDGDGVLRGDELSGLALWHDANGNGISEPGEVRPLADWGITELSVRYETYSTGIPFSPRGVRFGNGSTRPSYDWIARTKAK